jgi:hypothetical protein
MRSKHMLTWAFYCLFLTATFAQTINKNDYCWENLAPMRNSNDTLNAYKIARYQQCMRQVGYTQAQVDKFFGNYSCLNTHNIETFLKKHPTYCSKTPDG